MSPSSDPTLSSAYQAAIKSSDPTAWDSLATLVRRFGHLPPGIAPQDFLREVLVGLEAGTGPAQLLEAALPVRVPEGAAGIPQSLMLLPRNTAMLRSLSFSGWVAVEPLEVAKTPDARRHVAAAWFSAATHARRLNREARDAGALCESWEITLLEVQTPPYRRPATTLRLALAPVVLPRPRLQKDQLYRAAVGTERLEWLRLRPNGLIEFAAGLTSQPGQDRTRRAFDRGEGLLDGHYQLEDDNLSATLESGQGTLKLTGFLDSRGRLCARTILQSPKQKGVRRRGEDTHGFGQWELVET